MQDLLHQIRIHQYLPGLGSGSGRQLIFARTCKVCDFPLKGSPLMKMTSPQSEVSRQLTNDETLRCCQRALDLRDKGDYEGARQKMQPLWKSVGDHPEVKGLEPSVAAEVLLCVGVLTSWIQARKAKNCGAGSMRLPERSSRVCIGNQMLRLLPTHSRTDRLSFKRKY